MFSGSGAGGRGPLRLLSLELGCLPPWLGSACEFLLLPPFYGVKEVESPPRHLEDISWPRDGNGMAWGYSWDMVQYVFILGSFLSQLWALNTKCLLNEGELKKLACVETDTVLAGADWIWYQILDSFIMYSFLMQGTQLVLEEVRFGYDSTWYCSICLTTAPSAPLQAGYLNVADFWVFSSHASPCKWQGYINLYSLRSQSRTVWDLQMGNCYYFNFSTQNSCRVVCIIRGFSIKHYSDARIISEAVWLSRECFDIWT